MHTMLAGPHLDLAAGAQAMRCIGPSVLSEFDPEINSKWWLTAVIMFTASCDVL